MTTSSIFITSESVYNACVGLFSSPNIVYKNADHKTACHYLVAQPFQTAKGQ